MAKHHRSLHLQPLFQLFLHNPQHHRPHKPNGQWLPSQQRRRRSRHLRRAEYNGPNTLRSLNPKSMANIQRRCQPLHSVRNPASFPLLPPPPHQIPLTPSHQPPRKQRDRLPPEPLVTMGFRLRGRRLSRLLQQSILLPLQRKGRALPPLLLKTRYPKPRNLTPRSPSSNFPLPQQSNFRTPGYKHYGWHAMGRRYEG